MRCSPAVGPPNGLTASMPRRRGPPALQLGRHVGSHATRSDNLRARVSSRRSPPGVRLPLGGAFFRFRPQHGLRRHGLRLRSARRHWQRRRQALHRRRPNLGRSRHPRVMRRRLSNLSAAPSTSLGENVARSRDRGDTWVTGGPGLQGEVLRVGLGRAGTLVRRKCSPMAIVPRQLLSGHEPRARASSSRSGGGHVSLARTCRTRCQIAKYHCESIGQVLEVRTNGGVRGCTLVPIFEGVGEGVGGVGFRRTTPRAESKSPSAEPGRPHPAGIRT